MTDPASRPHGARTTGEQGPIPIVAASRSLPAGIGIAALGAVFATTTALLATDAALPGVVRAITAALGALVTLSALVGARRLLQRRGGLVLDREGTRLGVGLTDASDVWWLPLERMRGVRVVPRDAAEAPEGRLWTALIEMHDRPALVLAECVDPDEARHVASQMARATGLAHLDPEPPTPSGGEADVEEPDADAGEPAAVPMAEERSDEPAPLAGTAVFDIRRRAAMQGTLLMFGTSLSAVGGTLFAQVAEQPVIAILFAPLFMILGLALLGVVVLKRLAREELRHEDGRWTHRWTLGPWRWAEQCVRAKQPRWRVRAQAVRGARLELIGDDGVLVVGSGATTRSLDDVEGLSSLPGRFRAPAEPATSAP